MTLIQNGSSIPLNQNQGTVPYMGDALLDWFQQTTFVVVTKVIAAFQVIEEGEAIVFYGVVQPLTGRALQMKPEGQRKWNHFMVHSQTQLPLTIDDVIQYLGVQYRISAQKDYSLYGYYYYELTEDYTGSGPEIE